MNNLQKHIMNIKNQHPKPIQTRQLSRKEFNKIKALSQHIRKHEDFDNYVCLDNAIAHHLGGSDWKDDEFLMESMIFNLNRLLHEKGPEPTNQDLRDYITVHEDELLWHTEYCEKLLQLAVQNMAENKEAQHG